MALIPTRRKSSSSLRRGVALLLVLAMIIVIVPVAVGLAQRSILFRLDERSGRETTIGLSLCKQLEDGPLSYWLAKEASRVVLDVDAKTPRVDVLDDSWNLDGTDYHVRLAAWDQCGLVPFSAIHSGSPVRRTLPSAVLNRLSDVSVNARSRETLGLDQFRPATFVGLQTQPSVFPNGSTEDPVALGAWIATHPIGVAGSINVNTAPLPLIEAAMQMAGRSGIEIIIAARTEGARATVPGGPWTTDSAELRTSQPPKLVSSSNSWAVRIDISVGTTRRSWWAIYQRRSGRWECVQRLVIPD